MLLNTGTFVWWFISSASFHKIHTGNYYNFRTWRYRFVPSCHKQTSKSHNVSQKYFGTCNDRLSQVTVGVKLFLLIKITDRCNYITVHVHSVCSFSFTFCSFIICHLHFFFCFCFLLSILTLIRAAQLQRLLPLLQIPVQVPLRRGLLDGPKWLHCALHLPRLPETRAGGAAPP